MDEDQILTFAIPLFLFLIVVEYFYGIRDGKNTYRLNDTINNLSLGCLGLSIRLCTAFFEIGAYYLVYTSLHSSGGSSFWISPVGIVVAFLILDFLDYLAHRVSHTNAFLWAAHVVHHQSQRFNFSVALRQEPFYQVITFFFFMPMAVMGIPPGIFASLSALVLIYQFWIHTEHVPHLGKIEWIFNSPSSHRVHHAINSQYIDKNYGAVLIIWDRIFGTYQREEEPCVYGVVKPLNSWNVGRAFLGPYRDLFCEAIRAKGLKNKWRVLFGYPGGESPDTTDLVKHVQIYDPAWDIRSQYYATSVFLVTGLFTIGYLFIPDDTIYVVKLTGFLIIFLGFSLASRFMDPKKDRAYDL